MRITTWNINGYRAILKKDFKKTIQALSPDVLCLQEIKAKEDQVTKNEIDIIGYDYCWNSAQRPGYSGVATYTLKSPTSFQSKSGMGNSRFDIEGRVIQTFFNDFLLLNIYFPNGQRGKERVEYKLDFYEYLLELVNQETKNGMKIIITGDFNTAHTEIDLANPKENEKNSGFLPEERAWINKFIDHGFIDIFRYMYPNKVQYTWWTYRFNARKRGIGWRLDYFLISAEALPIIKDIVIYDQLEGSDHCPVTLEIL
ncbi:MAG: exodeoxyribonuclease III [Chloroflexi bacterium]|nr:exodeoxyribonuclease III [Chloroflexota bacterium]